MNRNQWLCALTDACQNKTSANYPNDDGFQQIPIDDNYGMAEHIPGSSLWFENRLISAAIQHSHYGKAFRWITDQSEVISRQQTSAISNGLEVADLVSKI
jgi:hypothetical protein